MFYLYTTIFEKRIQDIPVGHTVDSRMNPLWCGLIPILKLFCANSEVLEFLLTYMTLEWHIACIGNSGAKKKNVILNIKIQTPESAAL